MEQKKEAVYLINDERYLHLRENGAGVGFATYNKVTGEPLESGQISEKNLPPDGRNAISAARNWYLFELSDDDRKVIQQESVKILENIPQAGIGRRRIWEPETLPKDIRLINSHYDDLYRIRSVIAVSLEPRPVALLAVRNPKRYIQQTSMLRILAYVLLASYNEQKMLNRLQMAYIPTSIQSSKDIYVSLFGELSISTSKGVLKEADFSSPRISRLISYLLISRKNAISPQEITQTLWPDDLDNPAKNVKGLIYRLRQKFNLISDEPLILSSASGYQLNPKLHIMTDYQRFDELVSSAVRASSVINKVDILKNALDLYHGKVLSSADGEHWLIQFSTKYHLSYMGAVSELLKQLDSLHSYDLLNQYAMKSLTIAPDNPKAYCWLIRSLKAQGMNELATNELAAAKEHLTTEEYEEILAFGANW